MKKYINKFVVSLALIAVVSSCSSEFLDTEYTQGVDSKDALTTVARIETALNGAYYCLINYRFAGRDVTAVGDIASDLSNHNNATTHFKPIFDYNITDTDLYLDEMWEYGYKAVSGAARIIEAGEQMFPTATASEKETLNGILAQAYGIRALAYYYLVNIYSLPYKVDTGVDNGAKPGIVIVNKPIPPFTQVARATIAETYKAINDDIDASIAKYEAYEDTPDAAYMNHAAVYALRARVALASQKYEDAITAADDALAIAEDALSKGTMMYTANGLLGLYTSVADNTENIFYIARSSTDSFTALSIGTLYTTYGARPNSTYSGLLAGNDVRKVLLSIDGGKYVGIPSGSTYNPEISNIPLFRVPELHLIKAEAYLKQASPDEDAAKTALLEVAKRNTDITTVEDLPSGAALAAFIVDERARELFWEGFRFSDLRRWGKSVSVKNGKYTNFDIAKFCYPVPAAEINSGSGVTQNPNWSAALPK